MRAARSIVVLLVLLALLVASAALVGPTTDSVVVPAPGPDTAAPETGGVARAVAAAHADSPESPGALVAPPGSPGPDPSAEVTTASGSAHGEPALVIGTVRWPDGRAAGNVGIHGIGEVHAHGGGTYTDAAGLFTVPVPGGPFVVQAWSPDRKAAAVGAYVAEAGRRLTLDLTLVPLVPLTVWLVDPDGQRRPADWVQAEALSTPKLDLQSGRGALLVLPGRSRVTACHPDGSPRATAEIDIGTEPAELVLPVEASGRLEGVVVGPDDAPLPNLEVVVVRAPRDPSQSGGASWTARTDAAGRFTLDDLPADRFVLEARQLQRGWSGQVEVTLEPAAAVQLRLPLARRSSIRGRLVFPTSKCELVPIDLRLLGAEERVRPLHTSSHDGSFGCGWLPDGTYVVSVPDDWLPELAQALGVPRVLVRPVEVSVADGREGQVELRVETTP